MCRWVVSTTGVALAIIIAGLVPRVGMAQVGQKSIAVYGYGTVTAKPDVAYLPLDIATTAPLITDAYDENKKKVANTLETLKKLGIPETQIKVKEPVLFMGETYGGTDIPTYGVSNVIIVTLPGIDKLKPEDLRKKVFSLIQGTSRVAVSSWASPGKSMISGECSRGAREYGGYGVPVLYGLTQYKQLEEQAGRKAIDDAKKNAEKVAENLKVSLKDITYFSVYQSADYSYQGESILPEGPKSSSPEELTIRVSVSASYSFE